MTTRMLIDARHREETRVAVVKGNRIEEFDFESAEHKQLKGNIYLAKVTRVEPSLQAAFIEYGGNRHGFLAFSEIHPDYYQIPREDREALLREEAEHAAEEAALRAEEDMEELEGEVEDVVPPAPLGSDDGDNGNGDDDDGYDAEGYDAEAYDEQPGDGDEDRAESESDDRGQSDGGRRGGRGRNGRDQNRGRGRGRSRPSDELRDKRMALRRRYKIQDVIKRRQVMLVQIVKEERGNKGAALTTYLSLAGRYCVLMPNTSHGGGISRKISNSGDRKRLKSIIDELNLPPSVGCIVRTAGLERNKTEIRRDFDYLARLWDEIRERTLTASAPATIHSDSDLIKRAIRDIYNRDIEEVLVEGEDGYRAARDFMKLLMPSHARRVKHYADPVPLYQRYGAEDQLSAMYNPVVQLKSGGYLVINPTEALVSIDINSGRSTKEYGIEATALSTNLEAAREIARQLRLRDMAGLVVIDFIDMENNSNIRKVEKAMKEALKDDRARIQVGRISGFGLMEMSRQRLRTGVLEASTRQCPHCEGTGLVRTASSAALSALRLLEEEAAKGRGTQLTLRTSQEASFYVLNTKRAEISELEDRYGVMVEILPDGETEGARMSIDVSGPRPTHVPTFEPLIDDNDDDIEDFDDELDEADERPPAGDGEDADRGPRKKRRRRRGGRGRDRDDAAPSQDERTADEHSADNDDDADGEMVGEGSADGALEATGERGGDDEDGQRRRRRGRRGGRRRRGNVPAQTDGETTDGETTGDDTVAMPRPEGLEAPGPITDLEVQASNQIAEAAPQQTEPPRSRRRPRARPAEAADTPEVAQPEATEPVIDEAPKPKPRARKPKADAVAAPEPTSDEPVAPTEDVAPTKPARARRKPAGAKAPPIGTEAPAPVKPTPADFVQVVSRSADAANDGESIGPDGEPRRGWWQRTFGP